MPTSDARSKTERFYLLQKLFEHPGQRLRTREIAEHLGVNEDTVNRYIDELSGPGRLPLRKDGQYWILAEGARIEQLRVHLSLPEATALYVAGRLLSQIHDERNTHVIMALTKLIEAMPSSLHSHQHALIAMAEQRQHNQEDRSAIFEALALSWINHCKVRVHYAPLRKRAFDGLFSPYLLEPSGIGRTIYAIGLSEPPGALRSFKLERIEHVELTKEPFTIPVDFDGPALLTKAWGIMSGDEEPVTVRLRFTHYVTKRVKETQWHPSQQIIDTPQGCEWTAQIGDTLEIENWIRGWGADCEVIEPEKLREKMISDVRGLVRKYGINFKEPVAHTELDEDVFNSFFGE